jgi:peptidylprolyl isomerase
MSRQAKQGDTVRIHYTGALRDGRVFDSSRSRDPLEFTLGSGSVIPGFDAAVDGMSVGEEKKVTIACEDAYGPPRRDLVLDVERSRFPSPVAPRVGQQFEVQEEDRSIVVTVREVSDDRVKLDANHPLAGEDLVFDLQLVEIL